MATLKHLLDNLGGAPEYSGPGVREEGAPAAQPADERSWTNAMCALNVCEDEPHCDHDPKCPRADVERVMGLHDQAAAMITDPLGESLRAALRAEIERLVRDRERLRIICGAVIRGAQSAERELAEAREQIISGYYGEKVPQFSQGAPTHELAEVVTAVEVTHYVQRINGLLADLAEAQADAKRLRELLAGLQETYATALSPQMNAAIDAAMKEGQ